MGPAHPGLPPDHLPPLSPSPRLAGPAAVRPFPREALLADPAVAARRLLGALLVRSDGGTERVGRIVEVEAYAGPEDRASHARSGPTTRNAPMFGPPGHAYVYRVYGMHLCLNVVTGSDGVASATLLRAVEPVTGLAAMVRARAAAAAASRRDTDPARAAAAAERIAAEPPASVASGPGRLGAALGIALAMSGDDLCAGRGPLRLVLPAGKEGTGPVGEEWPVPDAGIVAGPRVGVAYAGEPWSSLPWRFALAGNEAVSRPRPGGRST